MTLAIAYPHDHRTREPRPMKAREIWEHCRGGAPSTSCRAVRTRASTSTVLSGRPKSMVVNGIAISTHWDLERTVHDGQGREALGVTEVDPALAGRRADQPERRGDRRAGLSQALDARP